MKAPPVNTVGVIATDLAVPVHRVRYVIDSRGIQAIGRAGNARIFDAAAVARIASEIRQIDAERQEAAP